VHFGPQICYLESPFDSFQKLWGLQQIVLFLKDEICELTSGDKLSGERKEWLIEQLRNTQCKALQAIHVCTHQTRVLASHRNRNRSLGASLGTSDASRHSRTRAWQATTDPTLSADRSDSRHLYCRTGWRIRSIELSMKRRS
jgi:hypothetical protein